jgi:transcriptional regulator with GAF, ATPase, and Fis domain
MATDEVNKLSPAGEVRQDLLESIAAAREVETAIASGVELKELWRLILEKTDVVLRQTGVAGFILLMSRQTGRLEPVAHRNLAGTGLTISAWEVWSPSAKAAFETRAPVEIPDLRADVSGPGVELSQRHGWASFLGLPLIAQDEPMGVLSVYTKEPLKFGGDETGLLSLLVTQAGAAIRYVRHNEEVRSRLVEIENDNKLKNQFLRSLSMDLRTPLNSVFGYASLLQDRILGEINPQQESALAGLVRSCQDQVIVINRIMEVIKIEMLKDQVVQGSRPLADAVDEFERDLIVTALKNTHYNQTKAASVLGTTRRILRYKMEKLGLVPPSSGPKKEEGADRGSTAGED